MNHLNISEEKLSVEHVSELVSSPECGAISMFLGTTRNNFEGKIVKQLQYEAYKSMALKELENICNQIRSKWESVQNIAIFHRLGTVPVKEASIIIAISSPHRIDGIKATEWCIDTVKKTVPIWKKEIYEDAKPEWKENKESEPPPSKILKKDIEIEQKVEVPFVPAHLIQIKTSREELTNRIRKFMERKRAEIDVNNIKEFCCGDRTSEYTCARVDAVVQKRKDSKSHLPVNRVLNTYHRDQFNSDYLTKHIPPNGVEERIENLECQLSLLTPVPKNIYKRIKLLEDRLMHLESISPEYVQFWDKTALPNKSMKKRIFSIEEIDELIADTEKKLANGSS